MEETFIPCRIKWSDAAHIGGWFSRNDLQRIIDEGLEVMETLGWLIHKGESFVLVAATVHGSKVSELMQIPTGMILEMHTLPAGRAETPRLAEDAYLVSGRLDD